MYLVELFGLEAVLGIALLLALHLPLLLHLLQPAIQPASPRRHPLRIYRPSTYANLSEYTDHRWTNLHHDDTNLLQFTDQSFRQST